MELKIKHPNKSEIFLLEIKIIENADDTIYKVTFSDKRLSVNYGTVELIRKPNSFWKFPDKADNFLISLLSETIFQIMQKEI